MTILYQSIMHLDTLLPQIIGSYGAWTYGILFFIIFCETGLVVTPFLPGDSLLFAAGAFAAAGSLDITTLLILLAVAAVVGDTVNYSIGRLVGPKIFSRTDVRFLNKEHLARAERFYEKYGKKTIIIARFIPIIRTFAPFVAGIGQMNYSQFIIYNILGGVSWVGLFLLGGYWFGNMPAVKHNFTAVIFAIIFISILPAVIEYIRHRFPNRQ